MTPAAPRAQPAVALSLLVVLFGLSFTLQLALTGEGDPAPLVFWLFLALGAIAALILTVLEPPSAVCAGWGAAAAPGHRPVRLREALPPLVGLVCAGLSTWLVAEDGPPSVATVAWIAGMLLVAGAALVWDRAVPAPRLERNPQRRQLDGAWRSPRPALLLAVVTAGAAALRLPGLDATPGFLHADEASNGLMGRIVAQGQLHTLFSRGWMDLPMLGYAWDGLFLKVFGDSLVSLRLSSAVLGVAAIALVGLLGKELFSWRAGLLAAALLTVYHLELHFSRDGIHNIQALFAVTLTLYLMVVALRRGSALALVGTGFALSLDAQVYFAARIAFLLVPASIAYVLLFTDRALLRSRLAMLGWGMLGFAVSVAPIGYYILDNWGAYMSHPAAVSIFNRLGNVPGADGYTLYHTTSAAQILLDQAWAAIRSFNVLGDTSLQYGLPHPILDPVSGALLPASFVYALLHLRRAGYGLLVMALVGSLVLAAVLTSETPFWPRLIVVPPILALLIGAFLDAVWTVADGVPGLRGAGMAAAGVLLVAVANGNLRWYFGEFQQQVRARPDGQALAVGEYLRAQPAGTAVYAITGGGLGTQFPQIQFLAPHIQGCDLQATVSPAPLDLRGCAITAPPARVFLLDPQRLPLLPAIQRRYPGGRILQLGEGWSGNAITAYSVGSSASSAAS